MTTRPPSRASRTAPPPDRADIPSRPYLLPSPNAATNLVIADIVMRGASSLLREGVERRIARASHNSDDDAPATPPVRGVVKTLALYGASKLATRSPLGLGVVVGALAVKTLYDIGKAREARKRRQPRTGEGADAGGEPAPTRHTRS